MSSTSPTDPSTELLGIARFRFHTGAVDEFKRLSTECMEVVRAREPGTLQRL
jgi:hypothetical protein